MEDSERRPRALALHGALTLLFYVAHAAWHLSHGSGWDLLWACNASMPLLVVGCFVPSARLVATAVLVLSYGTPAWLFDLATGASMIPTSPLVHVAAPVVAIDAVRRLGWPRGTWLFACAVTLALLGLARAVTPAAANVNLAFRVHDGWEGRFSSHPVYLACMWAASAVVFFAVESVVVRLRPSSR